MFVRQVISLVICLLVFDCPLAAQAAKKAERKGKAGAFLVDLSKLKRVAWQVDGVERVALVYVPAKNDQKRPLIFAFHGHGGRSEHLVRRFAFHDLWPEAVCVYPQGLPTPAPLVDPEGKRSGWQKYTGDQNDRDLHFFDAMLKTLLADYNVDEKRIYVAGHSNGGFFTYLLCSARHEKLTAVAPVAAAFAVRDFKNQKPIPTFHVAGENDRIVRFEAQKRTIERIRELNGCEPEGKPAGEYCVEYRSASGTGLVTYIHPGGHEIPDAAPKRIIEFFKSQEKK